MDHKRKRNATEGDIDEPIVDGDAVDNGSSSSATNVPTATEFISPPEEFLSLPPELQGVDFNQRVSWRKFAPYTNVPLPLTPIGVAPQFTSQHPALCFHVNGTSGRARATTVHLPSNRKVETPIFMPVG